MIRALHIKDLAVIDDLEIEFAPGLNILTGETGAGKSVILSALGLVLGERASSEIVRTGKPKAFVEADIDIQNCSAVQIFLKEQELTDGSELDLILSRQVSSAGRSRCQANGHLIPVYVLRSLGDLLVDIHGQHEHQSLLRSESHLDVLDGYGDLWPLRGTVRQFYDRIQASQKELKQLERERKEKLREKELLEFQSRELEEAALQEGEEEELEAEHNRLANAQRLAETADSVFRGLHNDGGTLDALRTMNTELTRLVELDKDLVEMTKRLDSALYELSDIADQLRAYRDGVEFNPQRFEEVENRLDLIYRLKRKYGNSIQEILAYQQQVDYSLRALSVSSAKIGDLRKQIQDAVEQARRHATELSRKRQACAADLETRIESELRELAMERTNFRVQVEERVAQDEKRTVLGATGIDQVEFLISPNVGEDLKPLTRIASGGETSRVMLALKTVLAQIDEVPTLLFDEIDAGIGGRTATVVGEKLRRLAQKRQVLCITHLPQIASVADAHFRVSKHIEGGRTVVRIARLSGEERTHEIARMLAGEATELNLAHARELLGMRS